jgi:hypothetical protein
MAIKIARRKQAESNSDELSEIVQILSEKCEAFERNQDSVVQVLITKEEQQKPTQPLKKTTVA